MILFLHIPKCGGKSLREGLKQAYGDGLQLYYNNPLKKPSYKQSAFFYFLKNLIKPVPVSGEIVYGHYSFNDFRKTIPDPDVRLASFFREPVEWVGSYLFYMAQKKPGSVTGDHLKDIKALGLDKAFSCFLGNVLPQRLDFVGLVENYDTSLELYKEMFGVSFAQKHINKTTDAPESYEEFFAEQGILSDVRDLMAANIKIYEQAQERFSELCKASGLND